MSVFRLIEAEKAHYPVSLLCRVLKVWQEWILCLERSLSIEALGGGPLLDRKDPGGS